MRRLSFLDNDSKFGQICTWTGTIIAANLLFIVTLIPIVTAGAGLCALYYTMLKLVRYKEVNPFRVFIRGFRENFKTATLAWVLLLLFGLFLTADLRICSFMSGMLHGCVYVIYAAGIAAGVIALYLFPVMASFRGGLFASVRNSMFFAGKNFLYVLIIACVTTVPMFMTYVHADMLPLYAFLWCLFGFALTAFCNSLLLMRLFAPHLTTDTRPSYQSD